MRAVVAAEPLAQLDYAVAVDATTPRSRSGRSTGHGALRLLIAARVGPVRLIDNCADAFGDAEPTIDTIHRADHINSKGQPEPMRRRMMKSKIHRATVTDANLNYVGSVSIDTELMALADVLPYEQVAVLDIDNGARFETYAIEGGPGQICLNGAAARLVAPGDKVIIITYAEYEQAELESYAPRVVHVDGRNRVIDESSARLDAELAPARVGVTQQAGPGPFDVLVLGSGVAGLSAAVRLAGPGAGGCDRAHPGCADQGRALAVGHPMGPGRCGRRARGRRGLDRSAPGRHAGRRGGAVRRGGGAGPGRRRARPGCTS